MNGNPIIVDDKPHEQRCHGRISRREAIARFGNEAGRWSAAGLLAAVPPGCVPVRNESEQESHAKPEKVWGKLGLADGRFQKPRAMTIAADELYIVDKTGRVQVFDVEGNFLRLWHTPAIETGKPTGLGVDRHGNVMVADTHYFRVLFYSAQGVLIDGRTIGGTNGPGVGQFAFVTDAVQDSKGNYFISEYGEFDRIQKYDANGKFICRFGETGGGPLQFSRPQCLMFDKDDNLWITDSCNHRIQVIRCEQEKPEVLQIIGGPGDQLGQFRYPYNLWLDGDELLYVSEFGNHRIQKLTRKGKPILTWGKPGRNAGELQQPWAIVKDSKGRLHILDTGNNRVQRVSI
jgi:sugar lactone lactonase YvrE